MTRAPMSSVSIAAISVALACGTAIAQNADAEVRFSEGEKLLAAGKIAEACEAFEASNAIEARAGTLINIGLCREKNHELATAAQAFADALARVKDPKKKKIAIDKLAALEPRLSKLTINAPRVDGIQVTRNGKPVDTLGRPMPVDGGTQTIEASAPGYEAWHGSITVATEKDNRVVDVPPLKKKPAAPPPVTTPVAVPEEPHDEPRGMTTRRKVAIGVGAAGLAVLGTGIALGVSARGLETDAFELCADFSVPCSDAAQANEMLDQARTRALLANIGYGVGGAAIVGAAVLWLTGGSHAETRVSVVPQGHGVAVRVRF